MSLNHAALKQNQKISLLQRNRSNLDSFDPEQNDLSEKSVFFSESENFSLYWNCVTSSQMTVSFTVLCFLFLDFNIFIMISTFQNPSSVEI